MSESNQRKNKIILLLLSISAFFASLNQNIYSPMIPLIRDTFETTIFWVNLTVSGFIFITAIMQVILGTFIDTKNQKKLLVFSLILTSISILFCAFTTNFVVFFIARMFQAIGTAMIPLIAVNVIAILFEGEERGDAMGTYQILLTLAPALAPILGGFIGQYYGYSGVFLFLFIISMILLIFLGYQLPTLNGQQTVDDRKERHMYQRYKILWSNKKGINVIGVGFLTFLIYFSILTYLPVLLHDHYQVSLQIIGLLYLPLTVSMILGSVLFKKLQRKFDLEKLYHVTLFLMPILIILFGIILEKNIIILSIVLFIYGVLLGFSSPLFSTMISNQYTNERGLALGLFNFVRYCGMAIGAGIVGVNFLNSTSLFIVLGILFLAFSLVLNQNQNVKIKEGSE
ncbi:MFS transporter [Aneurinibacillus thermoaerophilus]|uniref:MFS transporter n=1 Tax=Aneurinibacillus thermoaerophilus TaxID=143495 RepID=A0ABX8Y9I6_ANETH|nr:MFS transporter [Aneurinibacillus thermoaerophilus]MED0737112.1 MFS transporter [Aneurinibacillus thermoaerophilus]QYY42282.1 MFS transporter [Aneurinibacillus thermoaerophilus]